MFVHNIDTHKYGIFFVLNSFNVVADNDLSYFYIILF